MIVFLKVVLIAIMIITFIGAIGETEKGDLRASMTAICITSIMATVAAFIWM